MASRYFHPSKERCPCMNDERPIACECACHDAQREAVAEYERSPQYRPAPQPDAEGGR